MKRLVALAILIFSAHLSGAWDQKGHRIIAEVAMRYLDSSTKQKVLYILGSTTPVDAATWMDDQRGTRSYDYMLPWHYVNIDKGKYYRPAQGGDIISAIQKVFLEMLSAKRLSTEQQKKDLFILFNLIGDVHQPLHVGYASDNGGNNVRVRYGGRNTSLYRVWDDDLIDSLHLTAANVLDYAAQFSGDDFIDMNMIDVERWMEESRKLLPQVYDFNTDDLSGDYTARNKDVVLLQLLRAGVRLSAVLKWSYRNYIVEEPKEEEAKQEVPQKVEIQDTASAKQQTVQAVQAPVPLNAAALARKIGNPEYVCDKVYDAKYVAGTGVTFINVGGYSPSAPLVIVIFKTNRKKFSYKPESYLTGKNICVLGQIKVTGGKAEIIVTDPWQIVVR